jgi:hypothetical protein
MAGEFVAIVRLEHGLVNLLRPPVAGEGACLPRCGAGRSNAREKGASEGTSPSASQPHKRRKDGRCRMASIRSRVVAKSHTALAMYALHSASRSLGGQPPACRDAARRRQVAAPTVGGQVILRRAQFADGHELPMLLVQRSDLVLQHGEEP